MTSSEGDSDRNFNLLMQIQTQQGKIEGILQTVVAEHARRLSDLDNSNRQLRVDLTAVKDESERRVNTLGDRIQLKWDQASSDGAKKYSDVMSVLAEHKSELFNVKQDVVNIESKQHNSATRVAVIISPVIALMGLIATIYFTYHH